MHPGALLEGGEPNTLEFTDCCWDCCRYDHGGNPCKKPQPVAVKRNEKSYFDICAW